MEMEGGGMPRFVTFQNPEKQAAQIEADRAKEAALAPAPVAAPAAPVEAVKEPAVVQAAVKAAWPDFRGAARDGVSTEKILTAWPGGKLTELWRKPVGGGWASFVVAGNLLYTIEQRRQQEVIAAYDVATGREVWTHKYAADFQESMGGPGPRATPTWTVTMPLAILPTSMRSIRENVSFSTMRIWSARSCL